MKNNKRILALLLALVMVMTLFVGCGKQEEAVEEPHDHDHSAEAEVETEETAPVEPAKLAMAHHVNAHGFQSYSIHYFTDDNGETAFDYMNEAGELVSVSREDVEDYLDTVIATCGDYTFTNREMMYAYQDQYYQTYQVYGIYLMMMMDTSKALDEQKGGDGTNTWQHSFVEAGAAMCHRLAAVAAEAEANGFDTTKAETLLADARKSMEDAAAQVGYEDLEKFLVDSMSPGASLESYMNFYKLQAIFQTYTEYLQSQEEVTDEEIDAYWAENEESLSSSITKVDKNVVDVRHILVKPVETTAEDGTTSISDEAWAEAEAKANGIYEQWKSGAATEDSFAQLAKQHTEDPGSAETGGLYEDVYPGQMVTEFNDWCFADGREVGDTAIVKTTYGYHIMFFSGEGDYVYWRKAVTDQIVNERVAAVMEEIDAKYPMESDLTKVVLLDATAPTVPVAEEEAAAELPVEEHVHTEDSEH